MTVVIARPPSCRRHNPTVGSWLRGHPRAADKPVFVRTVAEAALITCSPDYEILRWWN